MLGLSSLAGWEDAVLASLGGARGSAEERDRQIERSGIYGEYPAIVNAYVELFKDEASMLEALKRAVFLVWRGAMTSPEATGIAALPEGTARTVVQALDAAVREGRTDDEFAWMLAWYLTEGSFVFELYGATQRVLELGSAVPPEGWLSAEIASRAMMQRGQLGRYWQALASRGA